MYLNLKLMNKYGLTIDDIINLVLIRQQRYEKVDNILSKRLDNDSLSKLEDKKLIMLVRGKTGDSDIAKLRLSNEGRKILEDINTAEVEENDIKIRDWIADIYKKSDKLIGNKKRIAQGIAQFRVASDISEDCLAFLLKTFVSDEKNFEYSQKLENVFFDASSVFDKAFKLERCRLWEYYERRQEYFDRKFTELLNR